MITPPVTRLLLITNFAVYALTLYAGGDLLYRFGLVPADFAFYQPITSMFLHGGLTHILFNMVALWSIGAPIERDIGPWRYAQLYFISGLGGAAMVMLLPIGDPGIPTVGASGAILGLLGALAVFYPNATMLLFFVIPVKARTLALGFGLLSLVLAFASSDSSISHAGHLGGLIAGLAYAKLIFSRMRAGGSPSGYGRTRPGGALDALFGGSGGGGAANDRPRPSYGSADRLANLELMRQLMREFAANPRRGMAHHGRFLENEERDVTPGGPLRPNDPPPSGHAPKRLYYDPSTGTFFFR